jgi:malonyl-CoA O-methyltransferase
MNEFLIDKHEVARAFSRAARSYDAAAVLQREVCGRMLERLDYIRLHPEKVLDAGCGTGWGTRQLAQRYPAAQVIGLDIAPGMLEVARDQSGWWRKLFSGNQQSLLCADIEILPLAAGSVEMTWSNLTLQWCNDLPATFRELHRVLKTEGLLMFSTFGPDTLKELRAAFHNVDGYNHVNRFADMHDLGDMLMHGGFAEPVMGLMGKAAWRHVTENYERLRRDGKLPATFEIVYGHAWKPKPRVTTDGAQIIQTPFKL